MSPVRKTHDGGLLLTRLPNDLVRVRSLYTLKRLPTGMDLLRDYRNGWKGILKSVGHFEGGLEEREERGEVSLSPNIVSDCREGGRESRKREERVRLKNVQNRVKS